MPAKYLISKSISCNVTNLSLAHEQVLYDIFWGTQQHQSSTVAVFQYNPFRLIAFGCTVNLFLISFRPPHRVMKERNPINEQEAMAVETPVTIQIVASAENTYLLQSCLKDILIDASGCCEYNGYVDQNGYVRVKIECIVSGQEKQQNWDQLTKLPI
jgi:hypothetical protein